MKPTIKRKLFIPAVVAGLLSGITAGLFLVLLRDLPQIQALEGYRPPAITRIYSSDNHLLSELYTERRDPVPLSKIPDALIRALLATEDRNFFQHSGIAVGGILRATVRNAIRGRYAEGASTLTQQLAKTLFLTPRKTMTRKLREAILAVQLERRYTKNEILSLYLNQIYLGSGAYGVSEASRRYFQKNVEALTTAECALLAGLPKAPSRYSPLNNPDLAIARRNTVLAQMKAVGAIDETAYRVALAESIEVGAPSGGGQPQPAPYFVAAVKDELEAAIGTNMMYKGGLTVRTTLRYDLQTSAETAVRQGLEALEMRQRVEGINGPPPQAALVALNANNGAILALVGGRDDVQSGFNRAVLARRQPGSAFKPLVYAAAIEQGWEQTDTVLDAPALFHGYDQSKDWQPQNYSRTYEGEISLRWALMHSKNIPAVRIAEDIGPSAVVDLARRMGLTDDLKPDLALALGGYEVSLLQLTNAYGVFANQGEYAGAYYLTEVLDIEGNTVWRGQPDRHIVMSRAGAAIITDMLTAVIESGTARRACDLPGPLAGKTGTTDAFKDAWFVGYSPSIVCGVWVGTDSSATLGPLETGARAALPIWMAFMQATLTNWSGQRYFDMPDGIVKTRVDPKSGKRGSHGIPGAVEALVRNGSHTP
jgi:penicillin-binding protein 1A